MRKEKGSKATVVALRHLLSAMASACSARHTAPMKFLPYVAGVVIGAALFGSFGKSLLSHTFVLLRHKLSFVSRADGCASRRSMFWRNSR